MSPLFEKFPPLVKNGKALVWDSRQLATGGPEHVVVVATDAAVVPAQKIAQDLRARQSQNSSSELETCPADLAGFLADLAIREWGSATRRLKVYGVTGTNGKSTSVAILRHLLTQNGLSCAEVGTLGLSIWRPGQAEPEHSEETGFTTPEAHQLHYLFHRLCQEGVESVAMEVSSHAIELGRLRGVVFAGGVFTNLTQDHLDFHRTMENYEASKLKFFRELLPPGSTAAINAQGEVGRRYLQAIEKRDLKKVAFAHSASALTGSLAPTYEILNSSADGLRLQWKSGVLVESPLVGDYNAENLMGCLELVKTSLGVAESRLAMQIQNFSGVSGRLERVTPLGAPFQAFVDYAHTPDALEKALAALRKVLQPGGLLYCVFGCGGDRDETKRPLMGAVASQGADRVIITSDNPRTEDPQRIVGQILAGTRGPHVHIEMDRRQAIGDALARLKPHDILLVAGKGHEQYQIIGHQKIPFSDQRIIRESLPG